MGNIEQVPFWIWAFQKKVTEKAFLYLTKLRLQLSGEQYIALSFSPKEFKTVCDSRSYSSAPKFDVDEKWILRNLWSHFVPCISISVRSCSLLDTNSMFGFLQNKLRCFPFNSFIVYDLDVDGAFLWLTLWGRMGYVLSDVSSELFFFFYWSLNPRENTKMRIQRWILSGHKILCPIAGTLLLPSRIADSKRYIQCYYWTLTIYLFCFAIL